MAILISDKVNFRTTTKIIRNKSSFYKNKKVNSSGDITTLTIYAPNQRGSNYTKQKLMVLQEKIDKSMVIIENFNTPLSKTD